MTHTLKTGYVDITHMLPSKGRFYDGARLSVRPYTFAEISSVSERLSLEVTDEVGAYKHILSGMEFGLRDDGACPEVASMFLGDFLFASFYRKVITTGTRQFTLANVIDGWESQPIQVSDINFRDLKAPSLPAYVTLLDEVVEFRPITVRQWLDHMTETGKHLQVNDIVRLMSNGDCDPTEVFDPADTDTLLEVIDLLDHGIDPVKVEVKRKGGDETRTVEVDLQTSQSTIVLPFRGSEEPRRSGVRFDRPDGDGSV